MKNTQEKNEKEEQNQVKYKIGTIGNFLLSTIMILIICTGSLTYYLINSAKKDYERQYNEILSNMELQEKDEEEPSSIANIINSAISNVSNSNSTVNANDSESKKIMNEKLIVLYNGLVLDTDKMDEINLQYIDKNSDEKEKYVITYYSYENYNFKEAKLGTLSTQIYDGLLKIDNVGKVAISEEYNAIPRNIKVVNTVPKIISDNNQKIADYDVIKTLIVDLDGNNQDEYIILMANKKTGFSKITLFDSKGIKIADLASIEKSKWENSTNTEYYLSINNIEIIDVDNDNNMEILIEIPHSVGLPTISLLKYKNGELQGKTGIECSLITE